MEATTKLELVACHLITQGRDGASALTALAKLRDLNMRNGVSDLRAVGVSICDEYFEHQHSGGGIARMKRYWPESADDVLKLVALVNLKRAKRNEEPISPEEVAKYLEPYEETPTEAGE